MADEIIEEVWRIKDELAREHGYDVGRLGAYFQRPERERAQRERGGVGTAAGGAGAVTWVDAEFGSRRRGGGDRAGT